MITIAKSKIFNYYLPLFLCAILILASGVFWYVYNKSEKAEAVVMSFLTTTGSNQTFNVPSDWNSSNNTIECIGAGGTGGNNNPGNNSGAGGGGGAYAKISNLSLTAGGTATYRVGAAGDNGTVGTFFNGTASTTASLFCDSGRNASVNTAGVGGNATSSIGTTKFAGGDGGSGISGVTRGAGGGGGGSAGPTGAGKNGGASSGAGGYIGGCGGGGSNGGSSTAGTACSSGTGGKNGGEGTSGSGHGVGASDGTGGNGTVGGGGGGSGVGVSGGGHGGNGGNDIAFDGTHGAGGGGAGGAGCDDSCKATGGNGGTYGGGSGGGGGTSAGATTPGTAGQGLIIITYTPSTGKTGNFVQQGGKVRQVGGKIIIK